MSGAQHTAESRERTRQRMRAAWMEPEYRARHTERLRRQALTARLGTGSAPLTPEERKLRFKVQKERWRAKRDAQGLPA